MFSLIISKNSKAIMPCGSKCGKEILGKIRWVWTLTYLACTCLFFYQLVQILPNYFAPSMTHTEVKDVPLKDLDFPLDFKVCFGPSASVYNRTALNELGYRDVNRYMLGMSKFEKFNFESNGSYVIGWGGHSNQSAPVNTASEVVQAVKWERWNKTQLFRVFQISTNFDDFWLTETVRLQKINPVNPCYLVDINMTEKNNFRGMQAVYMYLNETILRNNTTVELQLQGQNLNVHRKIKDHVFYHIGDPMRLDKYTTYSVKIKKRVFIEGDPGRTCKNYPNSEFKTYMECDDEYMKDKMEKVAPGLDLMPVWMTNDLRKVTTEPVVVTYKMLGKDNVNLSFKF